MYLIAYNIEESIWWLFLKHLVIIMFILINLDLEKSMIISNDDMALQL